MYKIFQVLLFIICFSIFSNLTFAQHLSDTSKVLLSFSEPMSHEGIFDTNNYQILKDDAILIKIFKVGVAAGDSLIVLFTEKQPPKSSYRIIINNLRDKAGNIISENHKMVGY